MGDSLALGLVQTVLENLGSAVLQEIGRLWGLKHDLDRLGSVLTTIQSVLKDAEVQQRKSHAVCDWLGKLKDAAYDAEDILDQVATHGLKRRLDRERGKTRQLKAYFSTQNPLAFKVKIAHKLKCIRETFEAIAQERLKFHLAEGVVMNNQIDNTLETRQTSSLVNEPEIFGRNDERDLIVEKLVSLKSMEGPNYLSVYAFCGMGGIGKTTLAQLVYNDDTVKGHFELRVWVCVSHDFSIERMVKAIIESIGDKCDVSEMDPMQRLLQEKLRGKRYLLVLDDVWSEENRLWGRLRETIRCGAEGSVVIATTRIEKVATTMEATYIHHLEYLSLEDSWLLFKRRAFATEDGENGELITIGEDIVKRCGGVPLAVKAMGSLMRSRSTQSEWLEIQASELWKLSDEENGIFPALRLSYDDLTPQMRQCFAYSCIFPKDYEMCEDELVKLWIANGFVCSAQKKFMPLDARRIFKELVWRSFFQNVRRDSRGRVVCQMHDLMHDLAESVMRHETYVVEKEKDFDVPKNIRHLSFEANMYKVKLSDNSKLKVPKYLRSFYGQQIGSFGDHEDGVSFILSKQRYLRVLYMQLEFSKRSLSIIYKLEHLRYLAMSCYGLKKLSESLIRLQNLQTLKLTSSGGLTELPKDLKYMRNLYFLEMSSWDSLVCTPPGLGEMTCLQELSIFIVGEESAHQIYQLKDLNLGGHLSIKGLENVINLEDGKSANLMSKVNLKSLELSWPENSDDNVEKYEEVLEGLEPNKNLKKIKIQLYPGIGLPKWMSTSNFKSLDEISLESCRELVRIPPFGNLPSLAVLKLKSLTSVKRLDAEWAGDGDRSFPALKHLIIEDMPSLEEWITQESVMSFACLTDLEIKGCPKLIAVPFLPALKNLDMKIDKNMLLVRSITSLTSVVELKLWGISDSDVLPEGLFQNHKDLKSLKIVDSSIRSLSNELDNLSALRTLGLSECRNLEVFPSIPPSLETLIIERCNSLTSIPATILEESSLVNLAIRNCKYPLSGALNNTASSTLKDLCIYECPEVVSLPENIQQLTALTRLGIYYCSRLCGLPNWLEDLQSLRELRVISCEKLECLPDSIQSLKSLRYLEIYGCPVLESRCAKPNGVYWRRISHIPEIYLAEEKIE